MQEATAWLWAMFPPVGPSMLVVLCFECRTHTTLHNKCSARWKNKMYYSVWEMFSLSYRKRSLMFYTSNVANFLNKRFGVNLSYSGSTNSRTPLESLQAKMHCLIFMVLHCLICKTGTPSSLLQNQRGIIHITDMNNTSFLIYEKTYIELPRMPKAFLPSWSWNPLPSLIHYTPQTYTHTSSLKLVENIPEDSVGRSQALCGFQYNN